MCSEFEYMRPARVCGELGYLKGIFDPGNRM
jgi:hypothetical protein